MYRMYWNNRDISVNWYVGVKGYELSYKKNVCLMKIGWD